jgi:hypothetical protein
MSSHRQVKISISRQRWVFLQNNVSQITIITHINYISFQSKIEVAGEFQIDLTDELFTPPETGHYIEHYFHPSLTILVEP